MEFVELNAEDIDDLLTTSTSGVYREVMTNFANAGIKGADVSDSFPGRKLSNANQALKRLSTQSEFKHIRVVYRPERDGQAARLVLVNESA